MKKDGLIAGVIALLICVISIYAFPPIEVKAHKELAPSATPRRAPLKARTVRKSITKKPSGWSWGEAGFTRTRTMKGRKKTKSQ